MKLLTLPIKTVLASSLLTIGFSQTVSADVLPANLYVSRTTYVSNPSLITIGQTLPGSGTAKAIADGSFPDVFKNEIPDASFGVSTPIYLDLLNTDGTFVKTINVDPTLMTTSFASKSEMALNVSTDGKSLSFMGYAAPAYALDVSNSNTTEAFDSTNPVTTTFARAIANLNLSSSALQVTNVNAYSGNNGRAVIQANGQYYMVGNAGNGSALGPGLSQLSDNTGVQTIAVGKSGDTSVIGAVQGTYGSATGYQRGFSISLIPDPAKPGSTYAADKTGKDNNYRGMTIFNNTLYVTKGSGSNGIDTVYQVGAAGALANGALLDPNSTISILPGFSTLSEKVAETAPITASPHPFGIWFGDANTLFVADEGDGVRIAAGVTGKITTFAGLQQWKLVGGTWKLAQTFQAGLVGQVSSPTGLSWKVQQDGLRNISGQKNADGSFTIYGTTSTVSDEISHDLGADPNQIVSITINANSTAANTSFNVLSAAPAGQRFGGVALVYQQNATVECLFNWAEKNYSNLFAAAGANTQQLSPYSYRYYQKTNSYLGFNYTNNDVYYIGANGVLQDVGALSVWQATSGCK